MVAMKIPRISVIVPVLDEERRIGDVLADLATREEIHEIIVVDGGSRDGTPEIVREVSWARLVVAPCGRGAQMNRGAAEATGEVLLFLHADVALPRGAGRLIAHTLDDPRVVGGAFRTRTVADSGPYRLGPLLRLADLRSRYTRLPYGDQALFVRSEAFRVVGGFAEIPILEDLELSRRLRRIGRLATVKQEVTVSGRRLTARPIYYASLMLVLPWLFRLGVPPARLAELYGDQR